MALADRDQARLLARDNVVPYRWDDDTVDAFIELTGSPYRAALFMVRQDIARQAFTGTATSKSIGDTSVSRTYTTAEMVGYANWLEEQLAKMDPLGGAVPTGLVFTEVASIFGVAMHDEHPEDFTQYIDEVL